MGLLHISAKWALGQPSSGAPRGSPGLSWFADESRLKAAHRMAQNFMDSHPFDVVTHLSPLTLAGMEVLLDS